MRTPRRFTSEFKAKVSLEAIIFSIHHLFESMCSALMQRARPGIGDTQRRQNRGLSKTNCPQTLGRGQKNRARYTRALLDFKRGTQSVHGAQRRA